MIPKATVPVNFGQGIDSKTDPKLVMPGKLIELENAVFTTAKKVTKRNGYIELPNAIYGGGTLTDVKMVRAYGDSLICAANHKVYAFSDELQQWVDRGSYTSGKLSVKSVAQTAYGTTGSGIDIAISGDYACVVWGGYSTTARAFAIFIDLNTNLPISDEIEWEARTPGAIPGVITGQKVVTIGTNKFGLLCADTAGILQLQIAEVTTSGVTIGSKIAMSAASGTEFLNPAGTLVPLDAIYNGTSGFWLAYGGGGGGTATVVLKKVSEAGAVLATLVTTNPTAASDARHVIMTLDAVTGGVFVYFQQYVSTQNFFYYLVADSAGASVLTPTLFFTGIAGSSPVDYSGIYGVHTGSGTQRAYYFECTDTTGTGTVRKIQVSYKDIDSAGTVGSATLELVNSLPCGKIVSYNGRNYIPLMAFPEGQLTAACYLYDLTGHEVVAVYGINTSKWQPAGGASFSTPTVYNNKILVPYEKVLAIVAGGTAFQVSLMEMDFASNEAYQGIEVNETLVLNGGIIKMFDGLDVVELGYVQAPHINGTTTALSGGSLADGTYQVVAVYEWYDRNGRFHQSIPSPAVSFAISGGGGSGKVDIALSTLGLTQKKSPRTPVRIAIYMTQASGTVFNLSTTTILNDPTVEELTATTVSALSSSAFIYTTGGVIENTFPPPAVAMSERNNRLHLISREEKNKHWYSKSFARGYGIEFSDLLTQDIPFEQGNVVAIAGMDEKLVFLCEDGPIVQAGDGANAIGVNATFTDFQVVPSDTGAISSRGVASFPFGVIFKSPKGVYVLDRSLSVKYMGLEVERYNSLTIVETTMIADRNQIRFLTSDGILLLFDYIFNQWSVFTNHSGISADIWQGNYTYVRSNGAIYNESSSSRLDGTTAYALKAKLAWMAMAGVQGFQRVRRVGLLGDFTNGSSASHSVQISAAYDFEATFSTPIPYALGAISAADAFQYRERLPRQKCDSLQLLIEEVTTGAQNEDIGFTDLSMEVGVKKGINKQPSTRSVG